jgi:hypothetical protein
VSDETREFPVSVLASLSSGIALCEFSKIHEAAEFLMGHPIWIHHFASEELWTAIREKLFAQHPKLPTALAGVTMDNYAEHITAIENQLDAAALCIRKGDGTTAMHPLEGIL